MKTFKNIGNLVRNKRVNHPKDYTQAEISKFLGDRDGFVISDIERGLRDIPEEYLSEICNILGISRDEIAEARRLDKESDDSSGDS